MMWLGVIAVNKHSVYERGLGRLAQHVAQGGG